MGFFNNSGFGGGSHSPHHGHGHGGHGHHGGHRMGYWAVVECGSIFFSGEIPGVSFSRFPFCKSYDELMRELTKALDNAMWKKPPMMSYDEVASKNRGKEIVQIFPTR